MALKILDRDRTAILSSLSAGVVPRAGLQHIQVGRTAEVAAMLEALKQIGNGSSSIRFVVGRFGAGKSFFLNLVQTVALEQRFVVARADISTERKLYATTGHARALFSELMKNLCTRGRPDGGALASLIEKWVGDVQHEVTSKGGNEADVPRRLADRCKPLQEMVGGYDFQHVVGQYYKGFLEQNETLQTCAIRWLRAEYTTKTEARQDLGVRTIVGDDTYYDHLKLLARFVRIAGYAGLLVCLDELVVLSHRLNNRTSRNNNYEAILRILNDCLQGNVEGIGFIFAATEECLTDPRRGLFSYEALATRLAGNRFVGEGLVDLLGPVITLPNLTPEECYVLLEKVRRVYARGSGEKNLLPDEGIEQYLQSCQARMGAACFQTPRDTIKDFIGLLNVLHQNRSADWRSLIKDIKTVNVTTVDPSVTAAAADEPSGAAAVDDDLATFKL